MNDKHRKLAVASLSDEVRTLVSVSSSITLINNSAASGRSMKQLLFSISYVPRDGESTLDEIEQPELVPDRRDG